LGQKRSLNQRPVPKFQERKIKKSRHETGEEEKTLKAEAASEKVCSKFSVKEEGKAVEVTQTVLRKSYCRGPGGRGDERSIGLNK